MRAICSAEPRDVPCNAASATARDSAFACTVAGDEDPFDVGLQTGIGREVRIEELDLRRIEQRGGMKDAGNDFIERLQGFPKIVHDARRQSEGDVSRRGVAGGLAPLEVAVAAVEGRWGTPSPLPEITHPLNDGFACAARPRTMHMPWCQRGAMAPGLACRMQSPLAQHHDSTHG